MRILVVSERKWIELGCRMDYSLHLEEPMRNHPQDIMCAARKIEKKVIISPMNGRKSTPKSWSAWMRP